MQDAINRSVRTSDWIASRLDKDAPIACDDVLAAAFCSIALDHREALILLLRHEATSAAFALARSIFEANLRGIWARQCATADEKKRAFDSGVLPATETMIRRLDQQKATQGVHGKHKRHSWRALSDYAHGGMKQISRWVGPDSISPQHDEVEIQELLWWSDMQGIIAAMTMAEIFSHDIAEHGHELLRIADASMKWKASISPNYRASTGMR